jgi:hypothetical protein
VAAGKTATITVNEDALAFISAVEAADGQALEAGVQNAYTDFINGCKTDGIWDAIKACCIMAGARTVAGALVPLKGSAPTNFNFVAGDYNQKTGLQGDGSTKYLNSNRNNNSDPQNSNHNAVYISESVGANGGRALIGSPDLNDGDNNLFEGLSTGNYVLTCRNRQTGAAVTIRSENFVVTGFVGVNRSSSATMTARAGGSNTSPSTTSVSPNANNILVFRRRNLSADYSPARMSFYSAGESLTLSLLDARVTALMTAIDNAI